MNYGINFGSQEVQKATMALMIENFNLKEKLRKSENKLKVSEHSYEKATRDIVALKEKVFELKGGVNIQDFVAGHKRGLPLARNLTRQEVKAGPKIKVGPKFWRNASYHNKANNRKLNLQQHGRPQPWKK